MDKVYFSGTHRCRAPGRTLEAIRPLLLDRFGVTRLADVTGLDTLGIPVVMAVRPAAATLSVSQGKGVTLDAAMVSAAMEAIELHYAEYQVPAPVCTAPAAVLDLPYSITALAGQPGSLVTSSAVLDWLPATGMLTGSGTLVPRDLVWMGRLGRLAWQPHQLTASSNGLASGNTVAEAACHALYELIERDAIALAAGRPDPVLTDLATLPGYCAEMAARIAAGGGDLQLLPLPSRTGVPVCQAFLRVEDSWWLGGGSGAHSDPAVAASRAITEACQSRLTIIAGTRDDIGDGAYRGITDPPPPLDPFPAVPFDGGAGWAIADDSGDAHAAAAAIQNITGHEPLQVILADEPEFAVVRILAPGLEFRPAHDTPRPGMAA